MNNQLCYLNPTPTTTTTYGPTYSKAVEYLETALSTTTWGSWLSGQTSVTATDHDDPFGQAAWSSMWEGVGSLRGYTTTGLDSTTASPTVAPIDELVLPPKDYFGPTDCYDFPEGFVFGVAGSAIPHYAYGVWLSEILKAIYEDGVNVMGALAWSFADNWEFGDYSQQFGLQKVNRTTQQRYYKKSFFDLVDFVNTRMPSPSS
ncbi:hypothetical protein BDV11DRAFT_175290 [Aspergillus similis]